MLCHRFGGIKEYPPKQGPACSVWMMCVLCLPGLAVLADPQQYSWVGKKVWILTLRVLKSTFFKKYFIKKALEGIHRIEKNFVFCFSLLQI